MAWVLIGYLLYDLAEPWVEQLAPELWHRLLAALDALSDAVLTVKHVLRAAR
jgi:uncharacterized protein YjeT (DUF2065 family)